MTDINPDIWLDGFHMVADVLTKLIHAGFTANSSKKFLQTGNVKDLRHSGKVSVQLFDPKA